MKLISSKFNGDICIYGTSPLGVFYSQIKKYNPKINIKYFIDKKAENGRYAIEGKNVYTLDEVKSKDYVPFIFIASIEYYHEIAQDYKS